MEDHGGTGADDPIFRWRLARNPRPARLPSAALPRPSSNTKCRRAGARPSTEVGTSHWLGFLLLGPPARRSCQLLAGGSACAWALSRPRSLCKKINPMNSTTFVLFGKYYSTVDQLGSKDSSRDFQLNCVISHFFTYI